MTGLVSRWEDIGSPPALLLPTHPWDEAHAALGRALTSLEQARDLDWVSVAAAQYRSVLAEVEQRVRRLMVTVDGWRDDWHRARALAWVNGQA